MGNISDIGEKAATRLEAQFRRLQVKLSPDPCEELFDIYLRCAKDHAGVHPDVYGEYCEEEKELYLECRRQQNE